MTRALCVAVCAAVLLSGCEDRAPLAPGALTPTTVITGTVRELPPSGDTSAPLPNTRIEVIGKPGVVATAMTDAAGAYRIDGVAGTFQVRASRPGYEVAVADVQNVAAPRTHDIGLRPIVGTLTGVVTESAPTEHIPVAGARVTVASGPNAGLTTATDQNGAYALSSVWGEFDVTIERTQYDPSTMHVIMQGAQTRLDVRLLPIGRDVVRTFGSESAGQFEPLHALVRVHRPGELAIVDWLAYGFEEGDGTTLQIWEDGRILVQTFVERSFPRRTMVLRANVVPGKTYEVRSVRGWQWYTATIRHPY